MKNIIYKLSGILILAIHLTSCTDYLDIVPDNIATIDDAFETRNAAEKYLFGCYNYMPNPADFNGNPAVFGSDEAWWNLEQADWIDGMAETKYFARGDQSSYNPLFNFWEGERGGKPLWKAIRDCNIFLEYMEDDNKVPYDLQPYERTQWIAEAKFLKAYYHYFLFQLYGPIPIVDVNKSVSSDPQELRIYRNTTDEVVEYIAGLLDEAKQGLPLDIQQMAISAGRPTKIMALALKAKLLTLAASPLFNGNKDFENYKDNRGINIFGDQVGVVDMNKWERAKEALKAAIDTAHLAEKRLYEYIKIREMSDTTALMLTLRGTVTEKWNEELLWGSTQGNNMQRKFFPRFAMNDAGYGCAELSITLEVAERFYSRNGVPIEEDMEWQANEFYNTRYTIKKAVPDHENEAFDHHRYIKEGEETALLNFYREPRFYATLGFDRGIYEGNGKTEEDEFYYIQGRKGENGGFRSSGEHLSTCYWNKKVCHFETLLSNGYNERRYSFPVIRLADLYLLYSEVLNEVKQSPDAEVYEWIDRVRKRAGLAGVVESWAKYSNNPSKPLSQYGMRQIIYQERSIEFAGEFQRFWDLRRWKEAVRELNRNNIQGWNYKGETAEEYYNIQTYYNKRTFSSKDYLWPIKNNTLLINPNFVQNPGW